MAELYEYAPGHGAVFLKVIAAAISRISSKNVEVDMLLVAALSLAAVFLLPLFARDGSRINYGQF